MGTTNKKEPVKKDLTSAQRLELMDKLKVDVLYKNHKNEYFVSPNLANLSITTEEKKEGKKFSTINRDSLKAE